MQEAINLTRTRYEEDTCTFQLNICRNEQPREISILLLNALEFGFRLLWVCCFPINRKCLVGVCFRRDLFYIRSAICHELVGHGLHWIQWIITIMATTLRLQYFIVIITSVSLHARFSYGFFQESPYRGVKIVTHGEPCPIPHYLPVRIEVYIDI